MLLHYNQELTKFFATNPDLSDEKLQEPAYLALLPPRKWYKQYLQLKVELARRFSLPCASLLLGLIAMPLGIQPPRMQKTWGASLSLFLGVLTFALYFGLMSIGSALGESGTVHPYVGAWVPNLATAGIGFLFLRKMGTEQWQSIAHAIEVVFVTLRNLTFGKLRT